MVSFRVTWYEEVLRQLCQGLTKCYLLAFENRGAVTTATITPHTLHFVKKIKSTFGLGIGEELLFIYFHSITLSNNVECVLMATNRFSLFYLALNRNATFLECRRIDFLLFPIINSNKYYIRNC